MICSNGCVDFNFGMQINSYYLVILKPAQNLLLCVSSMINKQLMELASTVSRLFSNFPHCVLMANSSLTFFVLYAYLVLYCLKEKVRGPGLVKPYLIVVYVNKS